MEELIRFLRTRRSVREYQNKDIEDKIIFEIIKSAMYAPSAHNKQPWEFFIVKNREKLNEIAKNHPYAKMLKKAPLCIVVLANTKKQPDSGYFSQDLSAATMNILLASWAYGIGSCWIGVYPKNERIEIVRNVLKIPEGFVPFSIVSLGYPKENPQTVERFDEKRIHTDIW
ncbi:MAG: nitroreductase family protein [bacterium]|nr:nitroreductase family protein [bacterium]